MVSTEIFCQLVFEDFEDNLKKTEPRDIPRK